MKCQKCQGDVLESFNYCHNCGTTLELQNQSKSLNTVKETKKPFSFEEFKKRVASQRIVKGSSCEVAKKKKCEDIKEVLVHVGIMKLTKGELKPDKGKGMSVRVPTNIRKAELLKRSIEKHAAHNQHFDKSKNFEILYPDGKEIITIPGQANQLFQLDKYKDDVGKPYNRISFYLVEHSVLKQSKGFSSSDDDKDEENSSAAGETPEDPIEYLKQKYRKGKRFDELCHKCGWKTEGLYSEGVHESPSGSIKVYCEDDKFDCPNCQLDELLCPGKTTEEKFSKYTSDPWTVIDGDQSDKDSDDESIIVTKEIHNAKSVGTAVEGDCGVTELLKLHVSSLFLAKSVKLIIRRSRPWRSFVREITQQNVDDTMNIEVTFTDSMSTVDDKGPRREFLRILRNSLVLQSGIFHETANQGAYVLTHNASKLNNHEYYMAGRAFAMCLIFGGDPPAVLSESIYDYITRGYDQTVPSVEDIPDMQHRDILEKLLKCDNQEELSKFMQQSDVMEIMFEAGYQNLAVKVKDVNTIISTVAKHLVIGKCRSELEDFSDGLKHYNVLDLVRSNAELFQPVFVPGTKDGIDGNYIINNFLPQFSDDGTNKREKEEDVYDMWLSFVRGTSETNSVVKAKDVLRFASGLENEPALGWGETSSPSLLFIESESKLPQARTCGPSILLPLAQYSTFEEFKENMESGIINSPHILLN